MSNHQKHQAFKKVGEYRFEASPFAFGDKSKIYRGMKANNNSWEFIIKCIEIKEAEKMSELITNEVTSAPVYKTIGCLINYQDIQRTSNNYYIIYSYFESQTLSNLISDSLKELHYDQKLEIAKNIWQAIFKLHQNKLMHRNLNTLHILVSSNLNSVLLCGLKSIYSYKNGYPIIAFGTEPYKAPEIDSECLVGKAYNEKIDVYSLGIILHQLFMGNELQTSINFSDIQASNGLSPGIKELLIGCLKSDPDSRVSSSDFASKNYFQPLITQNINIAEIHEKSKLSPYEVKGKIGEGSYGKVVVVIDKSTGEEYAMKKIKMKKLNSSKKAKELIYGEINLLYSLRDVNFVIKLIEAFHYRQRLCMILELCNGGTLDKQVTNLTYHNKFLSLDDIKLILWNLAEGINVLHNRNIVHRDLKPENVLLVKNKEGAIVDAKICDLGLGRQLKDFHPEFLTICGTELYMAPELRKKKEGKAAPQLTNKVDVFSFGLILYYMIYGKDAHTNQENKYDFANGIIDIPQPRPEISSELIDLLKDCLKPDPNERIPFSKIVQNSFFVKNNINPLPSEISFKKKNHIYESSSSFGIIDSSGKLWIKLYKENAMKSVQYQKYIQREIDFLFKSANILHIVPLVNYGYYENSIALVFQYCNGGNLQTLKDNKEKPQSNECFTKDEIKLVAKCLIEFIDQMHGKNYLHRGINPKHILTIVDEQNKIIDVKVSGFRYSKSENLDTKFSQMQEDYSSWFFDPNAYDEGFSEESDLWSIGMIIYFMTFGGLLSKDILQLKKIRNNGYISFPPNADDFSTKFINFCIKKRKKGELAQKIIKEELEKENILYFKN